MPSITSFWSSLRACSWLCSFLACCWLCSFHACCWLCSFHACCWLCSFSFFSSGSSICSRFWLHLELCSLPGVAVLRVRQSRPASAAHTVFCSVVPWFVKACAVLLRSSWHSMSRSPWHSMALQRRCPRADLSYASSRAARVEGVDFRLVVNSAMPCLWPLLCVAGNTSSLEPQPRRSAHCAFRRALLCSVSRDRPRWSFLPSRPCAGGHPMSPLCTSLLSLSTCVWGDRGSLPWSGFPRFGLRGRLPPKLSRCDSSQLSPLRLCASWSAGTPRRRHARID